MSDLESYVPLSLRGQTPRPGDLLPDEQVREIICKIPTPWQRHLLIRHMNESERSAYAQGGAHALRAAPSKEGPVPTTVQLCLLLGSGIGGYNRRMACVRWQDVAGLCAHPDCDAEGVMVQACRIFIAGQDKPLIAAHSIDELMPAFLKANKP